MDGADDLLKGSLVQCLAVGMPHIDIVDQDAIDGAAVQGHQQLDLQVAFPEDPQGVSSLLFHLHFYSDVVSSWKIFINVCTQEHIPL